MGQTVDNLKEENLKKLMDIICDLNKNSIKFEIIYIEEDKKVFDNYLYDYPKNMDKILMEFYIPTTKRHYLIYTIK